MKKCIQCIVIPVVVFAILTPVFIDMLDTFKEARKNYANAMRQMNRGCAQDAVDIEKDGLADICRLAPAVIEHWPIERALQRGADKILSYVDLKMLLLIGLVIFALLFLIMCVVCIKNNIRMWDQAALPFQHSTKKRE